MIKQIIGRSVMLLGCLTLLLINLTVIIYNLLLFPMMIFITIFSNKKYFIEIIEKYQSNIPCITRKNNETK